MLKIARIYYREDKIIIGSNHKTTDGVWIDPGPYEVCSGQIDPAELGRIIINALNSSKTGVPQPLEKAAGVKSYSTFIKGTKSCSVELSDKYNCIPYRNCGFKGDDKGFHKMPDEQISLSTNSSTEEIGQAVLDTLKRCK